MMDSPTKLNKAEEAKHFECTNKRDLNLKCPYCPMKFPSVQKLKPHINSVHSKYCGYHCEYPNCGMKYLHEGSLRRHVMTCHNIVSRAIGQASDVKGESEKCGKTSKNKQDFKCPQCPMKFLNREKLKNHINFIHSKFKFCEYPNCGARYLYEGSLRNHIMNCHNAVAGFKCTLCNTRYLTKNALYSHLRRKHVEDRKIIKNKIEEKFASETLSNSEDETEGKPTFDHTVDIKDEIEVEFDTGNTSNAEDQIEEKFAIEYTLDIKDETEEKPAYECTSEIKNEIEEKYVPDNDLMDKCDK